MFFFVAVIYVFVRRGFEKRDEDLFDERKNVDESYRVFLYKYRCVLTFLFVGM